MNNNISYDFIEHLLDRIEDYAKETKDELQKNKDDVFFQGKDLAYMEILDVIATELKANGIKEES